MKPNCLSRTQMIQSVIQNWEVWHYPLGTSVYKHYWSFASFIAWYSNKETGFYLQLEILLQGFQVKYVWNGMHTSLQWAEHGKDYIKLARVEKTPFPIFKTKQYRFLYFHVVKTSWWLGESGIDPNHCTTTSNVQLWRGLLLSLVFCENWNGGSFGETGFENVISFTIVE